MRVSQLLPEDRSDRWPVTAQAPLVGIGPGRAGVALHGSATVLGCGAVSVLSIPVLGNGGDSRNDGSERGAQVLGNAYPHLRDAGAERLLGSWRYVQRHSCELGVLIGRSQARPAAALDEAL